MSITKIEIAVMAPKTQAVTQVKQPELQKPFNEQTQISQQFSKEVKHNATAPVKTSKSEYNEYRYDAKEKGNNNSSNSNKNTKKKKNTKDEKNNQIGYSSSRPGSIDIKI